MEWAPNMTLGYLQKRQSVTLYKYQKHQVTSRSSHSWKLERCPGCERCCPSKCWWYPLHEVLHGIVMRRAGAKLGWWSNIFLIDVQAFIYSCIFKDLLTSVHFASNFSVHTIAGIFGVVTGEYYDRDLRICHIRRKSKISVNLAKQSPGDWLYTHQAGKYLGEWKAIYKGLKLFWKDWHKNK